MQITRCSIYNNKKKKTYNPHVVKHLWEMRENDLQIKH